MGRPDHLFVCSQRRRGGLQPRDELGVVRDSNEKIIRMGARNLQRSDVRKLSGGDSILLIDGSSERIVRCAKELVRRAGDFQERPMKMRFGGAAGPIAFERMRRMHNGSWDTVTVPMGLALRTSALLEPHAPPNCAILEEKFYEFGGSRDVRRKHADDYGALDAD